MSVTWETVANTPDGEPVQAVTLDNGCGMQARIMNFGATLMELRVPDREGRPIDVVLGFDEAKDYFSEHPYFGSVVGRYANRIANGRFTLDGVEYVLAANNGSHHLHGGKRGFDKALWRAVVAHAVPIPSVTWRYASPAGEEGYPGNLTAYVIYSLTKDNTLRLDYGARTDARTVVNMTNHAYFNLAGEGDVLDHALQIFGSRFLPVDAGLIPTGEQRPVAGTAMDFRSATAIRSRLAPDDPQLRDARGGYDHTWVLDHKHGDLALAARLQAPRTGVEMEVWTTQPGLQFYSGNFLDGSLAGKQGQRYEKHAGLCLETHHFPDSPNRPEFPSTVLAPGVAYRHTTVYRFSTF